MHRKTTRLLLIALVLAAALVLEGCATDPYSWQDRPTTSPLPAHIVEVPMGELARVCNIPAHNLQGCAVRNYSEGFCLIYTGPKPQQWLLAHELLHCAGYSHTRLNK